MSSQSADSLRQGTLEHVAVIGMSLKFPGEATSTEDFWQMLCNGNSATKIVPSDRFGVGAFYHENADRHDTVSRLCFLQTEGFHIWRVLTDIFR